jgi:hypothetical protein
MKGKRKKIRHEHCDKHPYKINGKKHPANTENNKQKYIVRQNLILKTTDNAHPEGGGVSKGLYTGYNELYCS